MVLVCTADAGVRVRRVDEGDKELRQRTDFATQQRIDTLQASE